MSKKETKPEFKRHHYLNWFPADWLGDTNLRLCPPDAKGFWMDLLMQMVECFPYGHLSRLSKPKMKESKLPIVRKILVGSLVHQNPDQNSWELVGQEKDQEDDQWVRLSVGLPLHEQLSLVVSLEDQVSDLLPYPAEKIKSWLEILDDLNIYSRTQSGIIYSRRMSRDFQKRKVAFVNACKGVNIYEVKSLKGNRSQRLVQQTGGQDAQQGADQTADQQTNQTGEQSVGGLGDQILSNSNSNSNSSYSNTLESSDNSSYGSSLGNTVDGNSKKNGVDGQSGSGNGSVNHPKTIDFTGLKNFKEQLLKDQSFLEPFLMAVPFKLEMEILSSWLDLFNLHCVVERKMEKDYREFMSHFRSWFFKADRNKIPPSAKQVKEVSKSVQKSKDLLSKYDTVL